MTKPSRNLSWAMGVSAPEQLRREADALDTKALGTFATASVIISIAAALSGSLQKDWTVAFFMRKTVDKV